MFSLYRNQSINLLCQSINWFLYDGNIGRYYFNWKSKVAFQPLNYFFSWGYANIFIFSTKGPMIIWRFSTRVEISSRLNSKPLFKMTLQLHVKKTVFSQPEMKLHPGMKIPNFPYNRHFFQPGMKIWYYALVNSLLIF